MKRITANSENLKKTFPKVYEDLFSKSSVVVSAPGSFWWTGEYSGSQGGVSILQKIPLRVYVGFEENSKQEEIFGKLNFFLPSEGRFFQDSLEEPIRSKLTKFILKNFRR